METVLGLIIPGAILAAGGLYNSRHRNRTGGPILGYTTVSEAGAPFYGFLGLAMLLIGLGYAAYLLFR